MTTIPKVRGNPRTLLEYKTHYCPGCGEAIAIRCIAEAIDALNLRENIIMIMGEGCYSEARLQYDIDVQMSSHGRACGQATGLKRVLPDRVVFTMQGDGDAAAEGLHDTIHAAARGENFTAFVLNNSLFGDTGGQLGPTTLMGQKTPTSPGGRRADRDGYPIKLPEMIAPLEGVAYVSRVAVHGPADVERATRAAIRAFEVQMEGRGFSLVEFLVMCPTHWLLEPVAALDYVKEKMMPVYPLGVLKDAAALRSAGNTGPRPVEA